MKHLLTTLLIISFIGINAQSEIGLNSRVSYQDKNFNYYDNSIFGSSDLDAYEGLNISHSSDIGYYYFINKNHGFGLAVGLSKNDYTYDNPIVLKNNTNEILAEITGQKLRFLDISTHYIFRTKKDQRSLWFELDNNIGILHGLVSELIMTSINDFQFTREPYTYYYLGIEPKLVYNIADLPFHITLGLPIRILYNSDLGTKLLAGVGLGINLSI